MTHNQHERTPPREGLWLLEQTCPDCQAWGTGHTLDDEGEDVVVTPEPWDVAASSLNDVTEVALEEVQYRLRNVYTGETVPEEVVLKSLGYESVLDTPDDDAIPPVRSA